MALTIAALAGGAWTSAAQPGAAPPDPRVLVQRACDVYGGLEAFRKLGILSMQMDREEITQDGKVVSDSTLVIMDTPGPLPGRLEIASSRTIAADDGTGGWALTNGKPDQRPTTQLMVKRTLTSYTFSLLAPFSLTWKDVTYKSVEPGMIAGRPVWRLEIEVASGFFASPQLSRTWFFDFDQGTGELVQATTPATDLGKGIKADGMLVTVPQRVKVGAVSLPAIEKAVGLDETGNQKAHTRTKTVKYKLISTAEARMLFPNPIPPDQRPKPPQMPVPDAAKRPS
ncbi:MAG TPA: hypothetical protein P5234_08940 [Thermoanaerobaculaceae bacterium]|nr:hypothetical protein [Thermoanaerobaculaceae bacterium]HRS16356.1 hypothetical protein [Thermoanaerobaculaceae bacterium]